MTDSELIFQIEKYKDVIIFGNTMIGKYLFERINRIPNKNVIMCDTSKKKQGRFGNVEVLSTNYVVENYQSGAFILSSDIYSDNMRKQLCDCGILDQNIFNGITDEAQNYYDENNNITKHKPLKKIQFEVDLVDHCNLNCKCCSQFSCIAKERFIELAEMDKEFKRMGELFRGVANRIYLIGGEPLLHPKIIECLEISRKYFPIGDISVFTNGLLLDKCSDEFWEKCRQLDISIIVTKYPVKTNYYNLKQLVTSKDVKFSFFGNSEDFKTMNNLGLDLYGKQNPEDSFRRCGEANNCIKLKDGKLYTCTRPAAIYKFNDFFKKELVVLDDDFFDIYNMQSGQEILERLSKTIPFCRYCNKEKSSRKSFEWGTTTRQIEEWL